MATPPAKAVEVVKVHLESYVRQQKACQSKLHTIWTDIGQPADQQCAELEDVCLAAQNVWSAAVEAAELRRQEMRSKVEDNLKEIARIKQVLEDGLAEAPSLLLEDGLAPLKTLKEISEEVQNNLELWRGKRQKRVQEYEVIMSVHLSLKQQLGLASLNAGDKPDISATNLEFLRLENEKLQAERVRRQQRLEAGLQRLAAACGELGEDAEAAAVDVHPSLRSRSQDKECAEVLTAMYKLAAAGSGAGSGSSSGSGGGGSMAPVDLSDITFGKLDAKINDMHALKAERSAHAEDLMEVLSSLWGALGIEESSPERSAFEHIMAGPQRLHARSLEKCMAEVSRLEGCKAQAMHDLIVSKARELAEACAATHIAAPDVSWLMGEVARRKAEHGTGQVADMLAKLVRMVGEVAGLAARRAPVLALVGELHEARAESEWLREYDNDDNRYKGRDANRKLQRAIKSAKLREKLPGLIAQLRAALAEWEAVEGGPFMYDGQDQREAVDIIAQELDAIMIEKEARGKGGAVATKAKAAASATTPAAATSATAGRGGAGVHRTTSSSSSAVVGGGATGPKTPSKGTATAPAGGGGGNASSVRPAFGSALDKPMLTPRGTDSSSRRQSLVGAPMYSARDGGVYGGGGRATPGTLHRNAATPVSSHQQPLHHQQVVQQEQRQQATPGGAAAGSLSASKTKPSGSAAAGGGLNAGTGTAATVAAAGVSSGSAQKDPFTAKLMRIMDSSPTHAVAQLRATPPAASPQQRRVLLSAGGATLPTTNAATTINTPTSGTTSQQAPRAAAATRAAGVSPAPALTPLNITVATITTNATNASSNAGAHGGSAAVGAGQGVAQQQEGEGEGWWGDDDALPQRDIITTPKSGAGGGGGGSGGAALKQQDSLRKVQALDGRSAASASSASKPSAAMATVTTATSTTAAAAAAAAASSMVSSSREGLLSPSSKVSRIPRLVLPS